MKEKKDRGWNWREVILCAAIVIVQIVALFWPEAVVAVGFILLGPILIIELL